jgi:hypothetical protein
MALSFIAKWLTYREPGAKEIDYLAAYLVATDSVAVEEWIVEVSGGKGRPRNVDPYLPPLDSLRHRRRVFRQWLVLGLGWDKQTNRWVFAREQPSEVSLSEEIGEDTDGDGEPVTRGDLITDESIVAIDPATFLFHRRPSLRFAFEYLEVAQGWRPGHPPRNNQPARPLPKAVRDEIKREQRRGGLHKRYEKQLGARWLKANPLLTWAELAGIRREIAGLDDGENLDWKGDPNPAWRSASISLWRHRNPHPESDPTRPLWKASDGFRSIDSTTAQDANVGANCPVCAAFVTSRQALIHHNCIHYLAQRKGLSVSGIALEQIIQTAVEAGNRPLVEKLEELIGVTVNRFGHPAEEAERILEDEAA